MRHLAASAALSAGAVAVICPPAHALPCAQNPSHHAQAEPARSHASEPVRRLADRMEEARRKEGAALLTLTDTAMAGRPAPSDFAIEWRNDFLKAEPGTFVPFTVTLKPAPPSASSVLMYVRAVRRADRDGARSGAAYPFETVFPVELSDTRGAPVRISRGFAVPPGDYDVYVAIRERAPDPAGIEPHRLRSAVLKQPISVPDFWTGELTTSTVMLADRIDSIPEPLAPTSMFERPYVLGDRDVHIAPSGSFRKDRELLVVFLIYNPAVGANHSFDIQVDYHLYRRALDTASVGTGAAPDQPAARAGERYVTRTSPQRLNRSSQETRVDPASGDPVMAGQGILLSSFQEGEYRLGITVTDLLSRKSLSRDVIFTVVGS